MRPGEKLFEELLNAEEGVDETEHKEIFKAICSRRLKKHELDSKIETLYKKINDGDVESIRELLKQIVPTYTYNGEKKELTEAVSNGVNGNGSHTNGYKNGHNPGSISDKEKAEPTSVLH